MTGFGLVFVQARINDSEPMLFALDSAASLPIIVDARRASRLGLRADETLTPQGGAGAGSYHAALSRGVGVRLHGLRFPAQTAAVIDLAPLEAVAGSLAR